MPLELRLTTSWTYIRMHTGRQGTGYSDPELETWAERVCDYLADGLDTFLYFNNDPGGHALKDADRIREMIAALHSRGREPGCLRVSS